jgi:ABC-type lipoprotein export system ATPase subunit
MKIRLKKVRKSFRRPDGTVAPALVIQDLSIDGGAQVCVAGGSGSGKTTLLNVIAGIVSPDAGAEVLIGETDVAKLGESARDRFRARNIGYVFQTFNLLQGYSALENVLLPMHFAGIPSREARLRAQALLDRMGISAKADNRPRALSVGEQQRAAVARALACRPAVVLADEPTANLDPENAGEAMQLLKEEAAREKATLIVVTHDDRVQDSFDHVVRMEGPK